MTQSNSSDKMANWPIKKLLFSMSLPAVFSMLIQAMYNIVDSVYISQISEDALFAVGIAYPLQMIVISIALGGAVGSSTLIARRLGQKDHAEANKTAATGLILAIFHWLLCLLIGVFLSRPFLSIFTQDATLVNMGNDYLSIVMIFSFGVFISVYFERLLQAQGNMMLPMFGQLLGAITNIILDPILIFGYFGLPALGIKGAAIATIIAQILSATFLCIMMVTRKHEIHFTFRGLHLRWTRIKAIYAVGLPVAVMNAIGSFTTTCLNYVLVGFTQTAVTALSLYSKLNSFVFMPVFGFNQGSLPILSYNYGAQNFERYTGTIRLYLKTALIYMTIGTIVFIFFPQLLLIPFNPSPELTTIAESCLRITSTSFIFASFSIVMSTVFQSLGKGVSSMMMQLLRQLLFLIPLALILSRIFGINGVWAAYPVAEGAVMFIFLPQCKKAVINSFPNKEIVENAG